MNVTPIQATTRPVPPASSTPRCTGILRGRHRQTLQHRDDGGDRPRQRHWPGQGGLHSEIVVPCLLHYDNDHIKSAYLDKLASGEMIGTIAMTEPAAAPRPRRMFDHYVLNDLKIFITNGYLSGVVIVVVKTGPAKGTSLLAVNISMLGMKAQDTCELYFDNVCVPARNLVGEDNNGFIYLMQELPLERLQIAIGAIASAEAAIEWTTKYVRERQAFGQPVMQFQNTRLTLAELKTEVQIGRVFADRCIKQLLAGKLDLTTASMVKYWCSDLQFKVLDARVQRIYGGTNEIVKELISRSL